METQQQQKEQMEVGYSEGGAAQIPERMLDIMRRNSEALEEITTKKARD